MSSKYNSHTEPLFKQLNLLKLSDIFNLQTLKYYYKFVNNSLPPYHQTLPIVSNRNVHDHDIRQSNKLHVQRTNKQLVKNCIRHNVIKIVNTTPNNILDKVNTHSLHGFAVYTKNFFIETYDPNCHIPNCYICGRS